jgi:hypothetical protein
VDPDSQQTGIAANAALPAFMRNILVEEWCQLSGT